MPNEVVGYSTQPVELFGVAPVGSVISDLFPRDAQRGDYHTHAVLDLYSDRRYDIFWDDEGHVRRLRRRCHAGRPSRGRRAAPWCCHFARQLLFAVLGQASGFPRRKEPVDRSLHDREPKGAAAGEPDCGTTGRSAG